MTEEINQSPIIQQVGLAEEFKGFISNNSEDIIFDTESLKNRIMDYSNDDLIVIEKQINSPTKIISVSLVDEDYLDDNL